MGKIWATFLLEIYVNVFLSDMVKAIYIFLAYELCSDFWFGQIGGLKYMMRLRLCGNHGPPFQRRCSAGPRRAFSRLEIGTRTRNPSKSRWVHHSLLPLEQEEPYREKDKNEDCQDGNRWQNFEQSFAPKCMNNHGFILDLACFKARASLLST